MLHCLWFSSIIHHPKGERPDWIHLATNGKWPVNTSQITAGETAEILNMILVEFGGTPMTSATSTSRKIRRFTHGDKAHKGKSAELCDFRHLYALSLVDSIVGQMTDILSNKKANPNWLYPLPLFTTLFDPRDAVNYPVRVSSFEAFAVQYYASLIPLNIPIATVIADASSHVDAWRKEKYRTKGNSTFIAEKKALTQHVGATQQPASPIWGKWITRQQLPIFIRLTTTPQHPHTPNAHPNADEPETANAEGDNAGDDTGEAEAEAEAASDKTEAEPEVPGGAGDSNNTANNRRRDGAPRDGDDDAEEEEEEEEEEERDFVDEFEPG